MFFIKNSLYNQLIEYQKEDYYPMHMPGHKRNIDLFPMDNPYKIDITEIENFDNLHDPQGVIKDAMSRAARVYGSEQTYFLINGSTCGLLAGISATTKKGDQILMARNCHKAVYNAVFLKELEPIYIYPPLEEEFGINGGISPEKVKEMLITYPNIKLIVITSPTYEGIVSNIKEIANLAHEKGIPLLVDEAHGAHFGFYKGFPKTSIENQADIVIHSVHKTLPAFTQTALLHINGSLISKEKIEEYLGIYQTSSPSYVLMSGIDRCMEMLEERGIILFENFYTLLMKFYKKAEDLKHIRIFYRDKKRKDIYDADLSKLIISVKNTTMTGMELYKILLNKYKIQLEMVSNDYVIAMTSICDTEKGFVDLLEALIEIDKTLDKKIVPWERTGNISISERKMSSYKTYDMDGEIVLLELSEGRIAKKYVYLYPPDIPLLVPGEKISAEFIRSIKVYKENGLVMKGIIDADVISIEVVSEEE